MSLDVSAGPVEVEVPSRKKNNINSYHKVLLDVSEGLVEVPNRRRITSNSFIYIFSVYFIQLCFICHPSDSTVSEDAGSEIELRTVVAETDKTL